MTMRPNHALALLALLLASGRAFAVETAVPLEPVYRTPLEGDKERFATCAEIASEKLASKVAGVAFLAVCTNEWPSGLVPVFGIERTNRFELRRRPARGEENSAEPLFFALPPEDEPDAAKITGHWRCNATRGSAADSFLAWQFAVEGDKLSGRFDPNSEYRVASITGGVFRSNRVELRVEYFMDAYILTGEWRAGRLKGDWRHIENSEHGTWEAQREPSSPPSATNTVALFEWRRPTDDARRYLLSGESMDPGWERAARPLCRVWRAAPAGDN